MSSKRPPKARKPPAPHPDDDTAAPRKKKGDDGAKASKPARPRKPVTAKPRPKAGSWRRWLLVEAATWTLAVALGLGIAGFFAWHKAKSDVRAFLAAPPTERPAVVYSAPIRLRVGEATTLPALAGDLLAAGYEQVDKLDAPGQFVVRGRRIELWTAALDTPGLKLAEAKGAVEIADGHVFSVEPKALVVAPTVLAVLGERERRRDTVKLSELSKWVEPALLSMEDRRFRDHAGVDPIGVARAVVANAMGREVQGGSTLTQQLAKNLFLSPERTVRRKVEEALLAGALESELGKDALLELYLTEVYLGQMGGVPIHGVEQAARAWFGVSAQRLSLAQAATIVATIPSPNRYSPARHPDANRERRALVLDAMVQTGAITREQADAAGEEPVEIRGTLPGAVRRAPFAVDLAIDEAEAVAGEGIAGWQLHTTIDPALQRLAEKVVRDGLDGLAADHPEIGGAEAALVAVDAHTGAILALVGSRSYADSPFDRASHAWRQVGSTVKPLTLLAAFDADPSLTPVDTIEDRPLVRTVDGAPWRPKDYDGQYLGDITIREAIEKSRNIPAVLLAEKVGWGPLQRFLRDAGLSKATNLPSVSLGAFPATPVELAGAFTVFPGGGTAHRPRVLHGLAGEDGHTVAVLGADEVRLASGRAAALASRVLEGVITDGTGRKAVEYGVRGEVGGKTGTTQDARDAWFVGFTPDVVVAVWVGHDKGKDLGLGGSQAALPIWARFVADSGAMGGHLPVPEGMETVKICVDSHLPAREACPVTEDELFGPGTVPDRKCDLHGGPLVKIGALFRKKDEPIGVDPPPAAHP